MGVEAFGQEAAVEGWIKTLSVGFPSRERREDRRGAALMAHRVTSRETNSLP